MKRKLFNEFEVRATLDGRKTQFREVIKPQYENQLIQFHPNGKWQHEFNPGKWVEMVNKKCPYGKIGDRLWVAETWAINPCISDGEFVYRATDSDWEVEMDNWRWKPSVQMQKQASRITLEVTGVRVERLNEISEQDTIAEGIDVKHGFDMIDASQKDYFLNYLRTDRKAWVASPIESFKSLWDSTNGRKHPWQSNPWVWVVDYKVVEYN